MSIPEIFGLVLGGLTILLNLSASIWFLSRANTHLKMLEKAVGKMDLKLDSVVNSVSELVVKVGANESRLVRVEDKVFA